MTLFAKFGSFLAAVSSYIGGSVRRSVRPSNNVKNFNKSSNLCPIDLNEVLFEFYGLWLSFERIKISKFCGGALRGAKMGVKTPFLVSRQSRWPFGFASVRPYVRPYVRSCPFSRKSAR